MSQTRAHPMMPEANHDELAQQRFLISFKSYVMQDLDPLDRQLFKEVAVPEFERREGRAPTTSKDVRPLLENEPFHQFWLASMRNVQELMWDNLGESVDRQLPQLTESFRNLGKVRGSLRLNPQMKIPRYIEAFDNHRMPGSYCVEAQPDDDLRAGALFDGAAHLYHLNRNGGEMNDARGWTLIEHIAERFPNFKPTRILDMGCSVGNSTMAYAQHWPDAEVHAIDLGAPMLRYAHARTEKLGAAVHYSQQNAEQTDFEDGFFDLVVSTACLHETNRTAIQRVMNECHRLLGPGGVVAHLEVPVRADHIGIWEQVRIDWESQVNNEPFMSGIMRTDYIELAKRAGFAADGAIAGYQWQSPPVIPGRKGFTFEGGPNGGLKMGSWYVFSATR